MDFDLSSEQREIHKLANDFADREIAPGARERDRAERFPWDVLKKMAPIGFLGGPIPEEYGGKGEVIGCFGLTEPAVGSDATRLQATAKRDGNDWVLNGRKMWISNGSVAKLALVFATVDPSKGHKGIT